MTLGGIRRMLRTHGRIMYLVIYEMIQRFNACGYQAMMFLFLIHELQLRLPTALGVYHVYVGLSCVVPLVATIVADLYINKALSIVLVSLYAFLGDALIIMAAVSFGEEGVASFVNYVTVLVTFGLLLRALGGGGMREIVRALGNDQFRRPAQDQQMLDFHQLLYYFMAFGTIVAYLVPPALRMHTRCMGQMFCFPLAFLVPTALMLLGYLAMLCGYWSFVKVTPGRSAIVEFALCIKAALGNRSGGGEHWIDNASHAYQDDFLDEMKEVLRVLVLFIPLPVFWALFDQSGSRWVHQASGMIAPIDAKAGWYVEPDQIQVVLPVMILIVLPVFEYLFYPRLTRLKYFLSTPKQRIAFGAFLAALAFLGAGLVQLELEPTLVVEPAPGHGNLLFANMMTSCPALFEGSEELGLEPFVGSPMDVLLLQHLPVQGTRAFNFTVKTINSTRYPCPLKLESIGPTETRLIEQKTVSILNGFLFETSGFFSDKPYTDLVFGRMIRCELQLPRVGVIYIVKKTSSNDVFRGLPNTRRMKGYEITFKDASRGAPLPDVVKFMDPNHFNIDFFHLPAKRFKVYNAKQNESSFNMNLERGQLVFVMAKWLNGPPIVYNFTAALPALSVSMWWQTPQYVILSIAEFLFPMALLEMAHSQVAIRMRPVLTSFYLLTIALGNMLVAILSFCDLFHREAYQYLLYFVLMLLDTALLWVLLCQHKPPADAAAGARGRADEDDESVDSVRSTASSQSVRSKPPPPPPPAKDGRCAIM